MAAQHNLTIEMGTDYETLVYIGLGDDSYEFANKDYRATLRGAYGGTPQYDFYITENSTTKAITINMYEATTKQLTAGTWVWDLIQNQSIQKNDGTNIYTTANGSAIVQVTWNSHLAKVGDKLTISQMTDPPGGYSAGDFNGTHSVTAVTNSNKFTITLTGNANANATDGDSYMSLEYETTRLLEGDVLVTPSVTGRADSSASTDG